jgi:hypothetical protein
MLARVADKKVTGSKKGVGHIKEDIRVLERSIDHGEPRGGF